MKRMTILVLVLLVAAIVVGCGEFEETSGAPTTLPARIAEPPVTDLDSDIIAIGEIGDDLSFRHLDNIIEDLVIEI